MIPLVFCSNFGGIPVPVGDGRCWVSPSIYLKLIGREIIFEVFQPIWSRYLNVTDRRTDVRTDWQTTYCDITAL